MSEENTNSTSVETIEDPILNVKKEMDRKLGNTHAELETLKQYQQQLLSEIQSIKQSTQPQRQSEVESLDKRLFSDTTGAIEEIERRAEERVLKKLEAQRSVETRSSATLNQLVSDYPELKDANSDLAKRAVAIYTNLVKEEGNSASPSLYKVAVYEAAQEAGVVPVKRRKQSEEFSLSGNQQPQQQPRVKSKELHDFAANLAGGDPKLLEILKKGIK